MEEEGGGSSRNGFASDRDWTKGSTARNLLSLSWPMIINESLWAIGFTIDMIWVGKLGAAPIAGVGVAGIIMMVMMTAMFGLSMGTRAIIARFVGAGDAIGANHVSRQAFVITGIYAIVVASIGVLFTEPIFNLFGLNPDVVSEGVAYLRIQFVGLVAMSFWVIAEGIMYASGDGLTPMKITIVARIVHAVLVPFLLFGWWIFPRMGVSGAALANVVAYSAGMALGLWSLFTGRTRVRLTLRNFRLDLNMIWRIVKIGIPASVMGIQRSLGRLALMRLIAPFGTLAVAAHTLCERIDTMLFLPSMGLGVAGGVLVGQNLGARQPEQAEKSGWMAASLAEVFVVVCSVAILLYSENIIGIFNTEPDLVKITSTFLKIAITGYLVLGFNAVLQQCISGAGDTLPPMLISLVMIWLVQLPLAFFLPQVTNLAVYGIRWAIVTSTVVGAVAYITYFRLGRWKRKKI